MEEKEKENEKGQVLSIFKRSIYQNSERFKREPFKKTYTHKRRHIFVLNCFFLRFHSIPRPPIVNLQSSFKLSHSLYFQFFAIEF